MTRMSLVLFIVSIFGAIGNFRLATGYRPDGWDIFGTLAGIICAITGCIALVVLFATI